MASSSKTLSGRSKLQSNYADGVALAVRFRSGIRAVLNCVKPGMPESESVEKSVTAFATKLSHEQEPAPQSSVLTGSVMPRGTATWTSDGYHHKEMLLSRHFDAK